MHADTTNAQIAHRYFADIWNRRDLSTVDELLAPDVTGHVSGRTIGGRSVLEDRIATLYGIYTGPRFTVEDTLAADDRVVMRWRFTGTHTGEYLGAPATGKQVDVTGMSIFRFDGGKIAELWVNADDLGELEQLGVLTPAGPPQPVGP